MSAGSDLRALLVADVAVAALVADRVRSDRAEQDDGPPYVAFTLTDTEIERCLDGSKASETAVFEVECWATSQTAANALADAVEEALDGVFQPVVGRTTAYDGGLDLCATVLTVRWDVD